MAGRRGNSHSHVPTKQTHMHTYTRVLDKAVRCVALSWIKSEGKTQNDASFGPYFLKKNPSVT